MPSLYPLGAPAREAIAGNRDRNVADQRQAIRSAEESLRVADWCAAHSIRDGETAYIRGAARFYATAAEHRRRATRSQRCLDLDTLYPEELTSR